MVDTGATVSLLPTSIFQSLNIPLDTEVKADLETYDGHKLNCVGTSKVQIVLNGEEKLEIFRVVQSSKTYGLLGRDILGSNASIFSVNAVLSFIKGVEASIRLKPDSHSMFCKARRIPYALENEV